MNKSEDERSDEYPELRKTSWLLPVCLTTIAVSLVSVGYAAAGLLS
jgi:hypothetical protein